MRGKAKTAEGAFLSHLLFDTHEVEKAMRTLMFLLLGAVVIARTASTGPITVAPIVDGLGFREAEIDLRVEARGSDDCARLSPRATCLLPLVGIRSKMTPIAAIRIKRSVRMHYI
jgi:hypothetical protein